ncbi:TonB-dependent receptor plug domain-containing protein [Gluconacetobacter azotocaptans]|uniref:TonB-dependent receptor plug domain-containing protein n=2 Tax=Gluconacetobacter azotocaptans TaxID=142834 RepID=A0A7W4PDE9_9PROT|nr:TonB-dependent receptor [Gluconacetobacter azotocaptans]MBB2190167.1 TonB-dependent receptor plug domain-containing protein [Gluconacetobacter azotocaptans]
MPAPGAAPSAVPVPATTPAAVAARPAVRADAPAPGAPAPAGEDILVHGAQNNGSRVQRSGIAISRLTRDQLVRAGVTTVNDLQRLVPNLQVEPAMGGGQPQFHLRGIGFFDYGSNNMPDVMTYVDGVAYPFGIMTQGVMYDLSAVEVERGPTGATAGRNTSGGDIDIITAEPTHRWTAGVMQDIANYARSKTDLFVSGPLARNVTFRLSAETNHGGGYLHNRDTGEHIGSTDRGAVRAKLNWDVDDTMNVSLNGHWAVDRSDATPGYIIKPFVTQAGKGVLIPVDTDHYATGWGISPQFASLIGVSPNQKPFRDNQTWGIDLSIRKDLPWARFTSVSAFEAMSRHEMNDWDATSSYEADNYFDTNLSVFSQEFRLASRRQGPLTWSAGLYYFKTDMQDRMVTDYMSTHMFINDTRYGQPDQSFSQFAQAVYRPITNFRLIFGLRHESEWKDLTNFYTQHHPGPQALTYDRHTGMDQVTGKVGFEYNVTRDILTYFNIRRGVKEGGFTAYNLTSPSQLAPIKPEWLVAYELGAKTEFFNHRVQVNGAAFKYDYHDQQVQSAIVDPVMGPIGKIVNAPRSSIWGVELEAQAEPVRGLHLSQTFGYERGEYNRFQIANLAATAALHVPGGLYTPVFTNMAGKDMGFPKLTLNGSAAYDIGLPGNYVLTPEVDYSYRSLQTAVLLGPLFNIKPYFLLNTSLTFRPKHGRWSVSGYVQNALDRTYDLTRNFFTTSDFGIVGPPRFYGARLSYTY